MTPRCCPPERGDGFYSLHRETYSVTTNSSGGTPTPAFLFAASRDVQRDGAQLTGEQCQACFYSLHRETYSVTAAWAGAALVAVGFLFAASRDVQRDCPTTTTKVTAVDGVSIRCIARRTA